MFFRDVRMSTSVIALKQPVDTLPAPQSSLPCDRDANESRDVGHDLPEQWPCQVALGKVRRTCGCYAHRSGRLGGAGGVLRALFGLLVLRSPTGARTIAMLDAFYRSGAIAFEGAGTYFDRVLDEFQGAPEVGGVGGLPD